jgi:LacI family transcriptional regulator
VSKRNLTIDDVARAAGVARVTVSRVLNNGPNVRPETRRRVQQAVAALGFTVNLQARALASGAGRQMMLIHSQSPEREPNSYYAAGIELGALRACSALGFDLVIRSIDPNGQDPSRLLRSIVEHERPAGIVVSPPLSDNPKLLIEAKRLNIPMVAISAGDEARALVLSIGIDEYAAGRAIAEHLIGLGHRRFGYVKGPADHRAAVLRYDGFVDALRDHGIDDLPSTATGDFTFKSGAEATERLLATALEMTALACANDDMAAGAMLALHRAGLRIPADISVTGFDDTPMSEVVWPPLTTVRQPIKLLAERAIHLLLDGNNRDATEPRHEVIEHELIVRESTAPIRATHTA